MKPFKLAPFCTDYIWGGNNLKLKYGKKTALDIVAESWELSAHKDGSSVISECFDSELMAMPFALFAEKYPHAIGTKATGSFPILIKLIDAKNNLSIQVHPDDDYAFKYENSPGKTEMWHVLECDDDAFLYMGFNRDLEPSQFISMINDNTIINALNKIRVKKGDVFFIEAGTIHAINKGIVLAEIQQNSNLTYRVYDYGRLGADGNPRELHIDKAVEVTNLKKREAVSGGVSITGESGEYTETLLAKCKYFTVYSVQLTGSYTHVTTDETFGSVLVVDGSLTVDYEGFKLDAFKGDSVFIPAGIGAAILKGNGRFLLTTL